MGCLIGKVYDINPQSIIDMKTELLSNIDETKPHTKCNEKFRQKVRAYQHSLGGHLSNIVFHV